MGSQKEADAAKLRICMLLPIILYEPNMIAPPQIAIFKPLADFGHEVTWVMQSEAKHQIKPLFLNKIHIYAIPEIRYFPGSSILSMMLNKVPGTLRRMRAALKIFKEEKCNIVFARSSTFDGLIAAYIKRAYKVPFVLQLPNPLEQQGEVYRICSKKPIFLYALVARLNKFMIVRLLHRADLVLAHGKWPNQHLAGRGIEVAKTMPLPNGVDVEAFVPRDGRQMRKRYLLNTSKVVIYVGKIAKPRKLDILIQAFSQVKKQVSDFRLLMVGDGPDRSNLEKLAEELGVRDDIIFTGQIPYSEMPDLIAAADVAVSPVPPLSFYKMSSPLKLPQYMAMSKPVVANEEIPEHKEVLEESGGGILTPFTPEAFADAIIELLDNPEKAAEMGRSGREWVLKNRNYEVLARQVEKELLALLDKCAKMK